MSRKTRLSVPLSDEIYKRIEEEARLRGVSMPTYVAFVLGDHIVSLDAERDYEMETSRRYGLMILEKIRKGEIKDYSLEELEKQ